MPDTPSPKHGIVRPADGDFINSWPATTRAIVDWLDPNIATFTDVMPRPAAGVEGRWHLSTDGTLSFDTGVAWVEVPYGSIAARLAAGAEDPLTVTYAMIGADVPLPEIGDQVPTASSVLPANGKWAWCDGSLIRADLYPAYMAAVGHAYNLGGADPGVDGSGNQLVRLPDKRGRGSIGAGAGAGLTNRARGVRSGVESVALSIAQIPSHAHLHAGGPNTQAAIYVDNMGPGVGDFGVVVQNAQPTNVNGGGGTHDNMQPYEADNWKVRIA